MGLTADLEEKWLYWLVRSYDGSELHRAPTADQINQGISEVCIFLILCNFGIVAMHSLNLIFYVLLT